MVVVQSFVFVQMKVSDGPSPAVKGHFRFDERCCSPQTHREPFRHTREALPDYTRGLLVFQVEAAPVNLRQKQTIPSPSFKQTLLFYVREKKQVSLTRLTWFCFLPGRTRYRVCGDTEVKNTLCLNGRCRLTDLARLVCSGNQEAPERVDVTQGRGPDRT